MKVSRKARTFRKVLPFALLAFGVIFLAARAAKAGTAALVESYKRKYKAALEAGALEMLSDAEAAMVAGDAAVSGSIMGEFTRLYDPMGLLGREIRGLARSWLVMRQLDGKGPTDEQWAEGERLYQERLDAEALGFTGRGASGRW